MVRPIRALGFLASLFTVVGCLGACVDSSGSGGDLVSLVPQQAEDYVHRIGRTGRAAKEGDAFTFMCADEIGMVRTVERVIGQEIPRISVAGFDFGT